MPTIVCPQCQGAFDAPDDLAPMNCVRCGQVVTPTSQAFRPFVEKQTSAAMNAAIELPERYASWEEFRSLSPAIQQQMMKLAMQPLPDLRRIRTLPLPPETLSQVDGWSKPLGSLIVPGETHISRWFAITIMIGYGLAIIVGLAFVFISGATNAAAQRRDDRLTLLIAVPFYVLSGGACLYFGWRQYSRRPRFGLTLWIFEEGLFMTRGGAMTAARWEQVQEFEMSNETGRPIFWLTLENEAPIVLSVGHCPEVMPLVEYMEIRMAGAQLLPRLKDIWDDHRLRFDAITLDREGIEAPRFFAPWNEVRRVMADAKSLHIDCDGLSNWHSVRYRDVSFPNLVMAIAQVLIKEHKRFSKNDA